MLGIRFAIIPYNVPLLFAILWKSCGQTVAKHFVLFVGEIGPKNSTVIIIFHEL